MTKITREKVEETRLVKTEERYTLRGVISDALYSIIHIENKKMVYTAIDLTIRPGVALKKIMEGYRQYLYNPLEYLIVVAAVISVLNIRYHFFANEYTQSSSGTNHGAYELAFLKEHKAFFDAFFVYSEEYPSIVNIVSIPVFTLFTYLFFMGYKRNLAENLIMNTYITAQQLLFLILLIPFDEFMPGNKHLLIPIYTGLTMIYNIWVYVNFFEGRVFPKFIRSVLVVIAAYLVQLPVNMGFYYVFEPFLKYLPEL